MTDFFVIASLFSVPVLIDDIDTLDGCQFYVVDIFARVYEVSCRQLAIEAAITPAFMMVVILIIIIDHGIDTRDHI